ncbi:hypothetical protein ACET3Z_032208 [Daucus carota]
MKKMLKDDILVLWLRCFPPPFFSILSLTPYMSQGVGSVDSACVKRYVDDTTSVYGQGSSSTSGVESDDSVSNLSITRGASREAYQLSSSIQRQLRYLW